MSPFHTKQMARRTTQHDDEQRTKPLLFSRFVSAKDNHDDEKTRMKVRLLVNDNDAAYILPPKEELEECLEEFQTAVQISEATLQKEYDELELKKILTEAIVHGEKQQDEVIQTLLIGSLHNIVRESENDNWIYER